MEYVIRMWDQTPSFAPSANYASIREGIETALKEDTGYVCPRCQGIVRPIDGRPISEVPVDNTQLEVERAHLGSIRSEVCW